MSRLCYWRKDPFTFQIRVNINVLEVFTVSKWRSICYVPWNHRSRQGIIEGKTLERVKRALALDEVLPENEEPRFDFKGVIVKNNPKE